MYKFIWVCAFLFGWSSIVGAQDHFDTGIVPADALPQQYMPLLAGKRVGLVVNQTSSVGDSTLPDMMLARGIKVTRIFVPEHGFRGREDAGANIENTVDSATGLPVISLYGKHKKPTEQDLADVDILVYDLQDVGVRFYTYISTLEYCMEACAQQKKKIIVLDKPDPNGFYIDGPVLEEQNHSFVGMHAIPIVYAMTPGEYALMLKGEGWFAGAPEADLSVIKCAGYTHRKRYKLPVAPSPNLRTMAAIYAYPSLCLFEGTTISVGRGTGIPFQQFGSPELQGRYTYSFTPHSGAGAKSPLYEGRTCYGDVAGLSADSVLAQIDGHLCLKWLTDAYAAYPVKDSFFNAFFVKLAGATQLQDQLKNGVPEKKIRKGWQSDIDAFRKRRSKYLLYAD